MSAVPSYAPDSGDRVHCDEWVVERSMPVRGAGFLANETLHEVHDAGAKLDETDQAFFGPGSKLDRYAEDELTFDGEDGQPGRRRYDPGTFIFRLVGRDRETSASYYTPEVLTDCLVKYARKELLDGGMELDPERPPLEADAILDLTVSQPAMGSGAFLVEAIDQLADAYLQRKQEELGQTLEPERYALEKQKVATHIAAHNCYGVDLNPMAARLAGVTLWLTTMHQGQEAPCFGARLAVRNSLVGARLAVWHADDLKTDDGLKKELTKVLKKHGGGADLEAIPDDYLPRISYLAACDPEEYRRRQPHLDGRPVSQRYRHIHRRMLPLRLLAPSTSLSAAENIPINIPNRRLTCTQCSGATSTSL